MTHRLRKASSFSPILLEALDAIGFVPCSRRRLLLLLLLIFWSVVSQPSSRCGPSKNLISDSRLSFSYVVIAQINHSLIFIDTERRLSKQAARISALRCMNMPVALILDNPLHRIVRRGGTVRGVKSLRLIHRLRIFMFYTTRQYLCDEKTRCVPIDISICSFIYGWLRFQRYTHLRCLHFSHSLCLDHCMRILLFYRNFIFICFFHILHDFGKAVSFDRDWINLVLLLIQIFNNYVAKLWTSGASFIFLLIIFSITAFLIQDFQLGNRLS